MRLAVLVCALGLVAVSAHAQKVEKAYIGRDDRVHIALEGKPEFVAPKELRPPKFGPKSDGPQRSVEPPVIAADGRTVGWIVNFPNGSTSYPVPLMLVIFRDGKIVQRFSDFLIFEYEFQKDGFEVAYYMDTLHGNQDPWVMLRDTVTGKKIDEWKPGMDKPIPEWAKSFEVNLKDRK